ncbi:MULTISPECIES: hydrogenase maturation peptidase HycI [Pasteurellaceae]|uniref:Hydrogenase maturation peptidase HycI n=1 Tax=Pasteurella bettyae CCUG 2042 TaxID=1095749 RepID=I3DCF4_9PAST|nr:MULTISPECIES: hydrogenase maturation peptidase HycI [Pasteurellaceae]EIJ69397.1 hydrogenase maturation peptidase HycI [Pasteurella bettyae CCUG 2042]SUB21379.1 Hydrogenase 3 maturation protease [Pasteurella bettyae]
MTTENVMLAVGNSMMGDDGAGPLLAEMMEANPIPNWTVVDGGSAPENYSHTVRALRPKRLLIVDASDMQQDIGSLRIIDKDLIAEMLFMSTHNMPLNYLIEQLEEDIEEIIFVGIQPDLVSFGFPMTEKVKAAVEHLYSLIKDNRINDIQAL